MPASDLESVAHLVGTTRIRCVSNFNDCFTAGQWYDLKTDEYRFDEKVTRHKPELSICEVVGNDTVVLVKDNNGRTHRFFSRPNKEGQYIHDESVLWNIFERPTIPTVAEKNPDLYLRNKFMLHSLEQMAGFSYMGQQLDYLARVAVNDSGVVAGQTGSGKSLFAISLIHLKAPLRALILAPQGTVRGSAKGGVSQWVSELRRFAVGWPVFELFTSDDVDKLLKENCGRLPEGVFVSWYQSFLLNGKETIASRVGSQMDFIALDEGHTISHLTSLVCQQALRLYARYRWVFTATAASNTISDLFPLIGWTAVPGWDSGTDKNERWPFTKHDLPAFEDRFLCTEHDLTKELATKHRHEVRSPVVSSPAQLIKLVSPNVAFISKRMANPDYVEAKVMDVRVPLGRQQSELYRYFMDRKKIPILNPLERARKQSVYLRNICADPAGFKRGGPKVDSNMNPKTMAIMRLCSQMVSRGDPVIVICARVGQSSTINALLKEAGVLVSRIDSTIPSAQHSHQSNLFKTHRTQVHIMGLKSAVAHGYNECPNQIIASVEWDSGTLNQANGRFDRAVSKCSRTLWVILNQNTIEETQWQACSTKEDSISLIVQGRRVPRDYRPVSMSEVLEESLSKFRYDESVDENECIKQWSTLKGMFKP